MDHTLSSVVLLCTAPGLPPQVIARFRHFEEADAFAAEQAHLCCAAAEGASGLQFEVLGPGNQRRVYAVRGRAEGAGEGNRPWRGPGALTLTLSRGERERRRSS